MIDAIFILSLALFLLCCATIVGTVYSLYQYVQQHKVWKHLQTIELHEHD